MSDIATIAAPASTPAQTPETNPNGKPKDVSAVSQETKSADNQTTSKEGEIQGAENSQKQEKPYKIKVNGVERSVSLEELVNLAQKSEGAEKKFQEAHKFRKQSEALVRLLKENPIAVLTNPNIGHDFKKLAEEYLYNEIQKEQMTPEQRELMELREKLKKNEEEKNLQKKKTEDEQFQNLVQHHHENFSKEIISALEVGNLPKTEHTVKRVAYYLMEGLKRGVELKPTDVVDLVRKDYIRDITQLFGSTDGDTLTQLLGDPILKKIRETELRKVRPNESVTPVSTTSSSNQSTKVEKLDPIAWREKLDKEFGK